MRHFVILIILSGMIQACGQAQTKQEYPLHAGDIAFDADVDDPDFKPCNENAIPQYYEFSKGVQYSGEKSALNKYFHDHLKVKGTKDDTGFLTIRFIVNCKGQTGRFRISGMDHHYRQKTFSDDLTRTFLDLTKKLPGWIAGEFEGRHYDYYQYLTFKINGGNLIEIMP